MEYEMKPAAEGLCMNNTGVFCDEHNCERCGWNPEVEAARKANIRERIVRERASK